MTYSHLDPALQRRVAWVAGKTVGTRPPLTQKQIWAIRFFLDREERLRDRALFDLASDSKLRGCDLVKLKIGDLVAGPDIRTRADAQNSSQALIPAGESSDSRQTIDGRSYRLERQRVLSQSHQKTRQGQQAQKCPRP